MLAFFVFYVLCLLIACLFVVLVCCVLYYGLFVVALFVGGVLGALFMFVFL